MKKLCSLISFLHHPEEKSILENLISHMNNDYENKI